MPDFHSSLIMASAALAGLVVLTSATLTGWRGWLQLKHRELTARELTAREPTPGAPGATQRIEIADLKERIRKLEAIAAGVEL